MHKRKATVLLTTGCSKARTLSQSPAAIRVRVARAGAAADRIKTGCSSKLQGKLLSEAQKQLFRKKVGYNSKQHSKLQAGHAIHPRSWIADGDSKLLGKLQAEHVNHLSS